MTVPPNDYASMRVAPYAQLEVTAEAIAERLEVASLDRALLDGAGAAPIPPGFAHHGLGGAALSKELARWLEEPAAARALSVALLPHPVGVGAVSVGGHPHVVADAAWLRGRWPGQHDAAYAGRVAAARQAVQRGAPTALEHALWLEHFLFEQLVPLGARLALPVEIVWPARRAPERPPLDALLDDATSSWGE